MTYITSSWKYKFTPKIGKKFDWEAMTTAYPWIRDLQGVPQDPIHHAEGDVYIHTRMVLEELIQSKDWCTLNETYRSIIFLATLMHDIGKPACTKQEGNRIISPHHAQRGAKMARRIMYQTMPEIPFKIREYIVFLVRHHGLPLWFWDKPDPEKKLIGVSQHISLRHLAILAEADAKGRICEDQEDLLSRIELFQETAEEYKCWNVPFPFKNGFARFNYHFKKESSPFYTPYDDTEFEVILLSGLPGAGKNTWVAQNAPDLPSICLDDIRRALNISPKGNQGRVIQAAKEQAKVYLRKKQPFVWNATNLFTQFRAPLVSLFTTYKARVRLIYIEVPYKTILQRNKTREYPVPVKIINRYIDGMEIPLLQEASTVDFFVL